LRRVDFPQKYGALELDRLMIQPGSGIPLVNSSLVLGTGDCAGKLSLFLEYSDKNWDSESMGNVKDKALVFLLGK